MKAYRCLLKENDDSIIPTIVLAVVFPLMIYQCIPPFFSEEFVQSSDFEKLICVVCAGFVLSTVTIVLFASVNFNLWAAVKWRILPDGLHGKNPLGGERIVPWGEIQDACICDLYGIRGKSFRVVRFTTDKKADDKLRIKSRKKRFWKNWPLWLDLDYNYNHRKKIVIIEYLPELEIECKKYFYLRREYIIPYAGT